MTEINSIGQVFKEAFSEHMLEFLLTIFCSNKYLCSIVLHFQYISETELKRYSLLLIGQCVFYSVAGITELRFLCYKSVLIRV